MIRPLLPDKPTRGEPRRHDRRSIVDGILYLLVNRCTWRNLPASFPPRSTVYDYFAEWQADGTWQQVHDALRDQARTALGKAATPTAAIVDSQSVKTTEKGATGATMRPSTSAGASGTSSWIPMASCYSVCTRQTSRTGRWLMPASST